MLLMLLMLSTIWVHEAASQEIVSQTVDPFMSDAQRRRIEAVLQRPCPFEWAPGTTVEQVRTDLATLIPTTINYRSLEEIGLTANQPFHDVDDVAPGGRGKQMERTPRAQPDPFSSDPFASDPFANDPFAGTPSAGDSAADDLQMDAASASLRWWQRSGQDGDPWSAVAGGVKHQPVPPEPPSIGARLRQLCGSLDLAITIRGGQLVLQTVEEAEWVLDRRIYDVTPLLGREPAGAFRSDPDPSRGYSSGGAMGYQARDRFGRGSASGGKTQQLLDTIEATVSPETWEALGGPSTMQVFATGKRTWLVVTTTTEVHWQLQALLNRLND